MSEKKKNEIPAAQPAGGKFNVNKNLKTVVFDSGFNKLEIQFADKEKPQRTIEQPGRLMEVQDSSFIQVQINPIIEGAEPVVELIDKFAIVGLRLS